MIANPSSTSASHQASPTTRTTSTRKPLSCTSCRHRKVKCDRVDPCDPCLKSGLDCVFPTRRARASRAQREAGEARDAELLRRIRRLEDMLANKSDLRHSDPAGERQSSALLLPIPTSGDPSQALQPGLDLEDTYATFAKQQGSSSRHLDREFWSGLSNEFDGLRQLIEGDVDDDDEFDNSAPHSVEAADSSPSFIFQDSNSVVSSDLVRPSYAHSGVLFQLYFANVDPVCKILHRPTATTYFSNLEALVDPLTNQFKFKSFAAVTFAMYFAAVVSMPPEECLTQLGDSKDVLVVRFRRDTEVALVAADFLNSLEIITLQALTIYIVSTPECRTCFQYPTLSSDEVVSSYDCLPKNTYLYLILPAC
jgi:hypothetical protein